MRETHGRRFRRSFEDRWDGDRTVAAGRPGRVFRAVALLVLSLNWVFRGARRPPHTRSSRRPHRRPERRSGRVRTSSACGLPNR